MQTELNVLGLPKAFLKKTFIFDKYCLVLPKSYKDFSIYRKKNYTFSYVFDSTFEISYCKVEI